MRLGAAPDGHLPAVSLRGMDSVTFIKVMIVPLALGGAYLLIRLLVPGVLGVLLAVAVVAVGLWLVVRKFGGGRGGSLAR